MYQRITDWSRDGRYLMYKQAPGVNEQLWAVPLFGDRKPVPYTNSSVQEHGGVFSNDGRWVAHISNETGRLEIFVRPGPLDEAKEFLMSRTVRELPARSAKV